VVCAGKVEVEDLVLYCREKLASFKAPREFVVVEKLPRNAMGKIQKHLLA
jgi:malonyl-CoA/methylmalonyl-CoA synthetase